MKAIAILSVVVCLSAGCQLVPVSWGGSKQAPPVQRTAPIASEPVLYARDGTVVSPATHGSAGSLPRRDVQDGEGTRTKLLELYERVVEERDGLKAALAAREGELAQAKKQLEKETARANESEARSTAAERTSSDLTAQNLDLAGRLTTAQIKRLEAEKKWLELAIGTPAKTIPTSTVAPPAPGATPPASKEPAKEPAKDAAKDAAKEPAKDPPAKSGQKP